MFRRVAIRNLIVDREGLDEAHVVKLKESIEAGLLLNPITINKQMKIIAGRHRYWAERDLGHKKVDVHIVDLDERGEQLASIDENLVRKDRTALEMGMLLHARKVLYEALHPDAPKRGGDRSKTTNVRSATADAASATGRTGRSVQRYVSVAERIDPKARATIEKTEAADNLDDLQRLSRMDPQQQRAVAARVAKTGVTVKQAARELKRAEQVEQARAHTFPTGEYPVISIDPPWPYEDTLDGSDAARGGTPYPTMSIAEIAALELPLAADAAVFLWVTNSHLIDPNAYGLVAGSWQLRYGLQPKQIRTWVKPRMGLGRYWRNDTEHLVLLVRGRPAFAPVTQTTSLNAPLGTHSAKPAQAYADIEEMCPAGPRLEMFARAERPGWVTSGSELPAEGA